MSSQYEVHNITEEIAKLTKQVLVIQKLQAQGYIEPASYHERLNEINSEILSLSKVKKTLTGKDECDTAIKNTTRIITLIDKKGAISSFDKTTFEALVEKIIAKKNMLTFKLINGMRITVNAEE